MIIYRRKGRNSSGLVKGKDISMKDYNHNTSKQLTVIERTCVTNNLFTECDIEMLHRKYEEVRYRFLTAEEFCMYCQNDWYHFDDLFVDGPKDNIGLHTHVWASEDTKDAVKTWYDRMLKDNAPVIEVGTPATVYYWSDHRAATITLVEYYKNGKKDAAGNPIPKKIGVNLNEVKCLDYYAGNYDVIPMTDPEQLKQVHDTFTLRKGGRWISEGNTTGDGLSLGIGYQSHYIDPSF